MINNQYEPFFESLLQTPLEKWAKTLPKHLYAALDQSRHGNIEKWHAILKQLPTIKPSLVDLESSTIQIGCHNDCNSKTRYHLEQLLRQFHPWRKGPFNLFGIQIDTEWRSDWKWDRLKDHIEPLSNRMVLDVGCGNGYHCWRMAGCGAKKVIGIDPTMLFVYQFHAIQHYIKSSTVHLLPLGIEALPSESHAFDSIFSMGVLYHRRSPLDHLLDLRGLLRQEGQLILETLVIDGALNEVLVPQGRYAKMRNVWFIPSILTLESWLKRCGFKNIELVDVSQTSTDEQRSTCWMRFESLKDFLNPKNPNLTIEGHPSPKRAILLSIKR